MFTVSPESGVISRITQDQGRTNEEPSWAPNGRLMVFRTDRSGGAQLVVSDAEGQPPDRDPAAAGDLMAADLGPAAR